ncbi:uncharacterized protein PRCAT00002627001 [Priceomyces carsonii]|uniref:uncharacterized protein n=1 Tax=Priceomyces carsonii TaxID=28549 RepID=UPI002EDAFCA3|nr:unnamed protein product [Priceomyces carsonii]
MIYKKYIKLIATLLIVFFLIHFLTSLRQYSGSQGAESTKKREFTSELLKVDWKKHGFNYQTNRLARLPKQASVREQLAFHFPYDILQPFQKNIWQTWKVSLDHKEFPLKYKNFQSSWSEKNPDYVHHILSDSECHEFVNQAYSTVPDVAEAYNIMPKSILKADFFRYLVLFARGGVYSDIDTVDLKLIDTWVSLNEMLFGKPNIAGLVVGIEADPDRPDWAQYYARRIQFCQWTIQAKKGHPMLRELITKITELTLWRKKELKLTSVLGKDEGGDVMNWTGPGIWTDYLFQYMNSLLQSEDDSKSKEDDQVITWKVFTGMEMPIAIEDVLILPITSFSPDVGHMGSKGSNDPMAYVLHRFLGGWKTD